MTYRPNFIAYLIFFCCFLICKNGFAQNSISKSLENNFKTLATGCFGGNSYTTKFLPTALLAHPMASEVKYKKISNVSFGALSTLVYKNQSLEEAITAQNKNFLSELDNYSPSISQDSRYASLTYNFSCTSALRVALLAGLNPSPILGPTLSIQAGLNAEMNNEANTGLVILYGRFQSPFSAMLMDSKPAVRLSAYSAIWKYYVDNNPAPASPTYLDFLEGWFVSSTTAENASKALKANAEAKLHALLMNADWSSSASVQYTSNFKSQNFDIYVIKDDDSPLGYNYKTYSLPKPSEIGKELERNSFLYPDFAQVISGQSSQFKIVMAGLNSFFCATQQWEASVASPAVVLSSRNSIDADTKSCIVNVELALPAAPGLGGSTQLKLSNKHNGVAGNDITFFKKISFRDSTYPNAHISDLPKTQLHASNDSDVLVTLDLPIVIETENGVPTPTDVRVNNSTLNCQPVDATKPQLAPVAALMSTYTSQPVSLIRSTFAFKKANFPDALCTISSFLDFSYKGNLVQGRQISASISLDRGKLPLQ